MIFKGWRHTEEGHRHRILSYNVRTCVAQVIGVDISAEAVADARRNAAINRITKAEFRAGAVEDVLEELVRSAQFHDILAVIGERFLIYICYLFPVPDVPFS